MVTLCDLLAHMVDFNEHFRSTAEPLIQQLAIFFSYRTTYILCPTGRR